MTREIAGRRTAAPFATRLLLASLLAARLAAPLAAQAGAASAVGNPGYDIGTPPPDPVAVRLYTGDGVPCLPSTANLRMSPDNSTLIGEYGTLVAGVGEGFRPTDYRRNCSASFMVYVPAGYSYAVARIRQRGQADLAAGITATIRHQHYFSGTPLGAIRSHGLAGPLAGSWEFVDDESELQYSPCGDLRYLNTNQEVRLKAPAGTTIPSFVDMSATESNPSVGYHLTWRRCTALAGGRPGPSRSRAR